MIITIRSLLVNKARENQGVVEPRIDRNVLRLSTGRKFYDGFQVRHRVRNIKDRQKSGSLAAASAKTFPDLSE